MISSQFKLPTFAVVALHELVGRFEIGDPDIFGIPQQLLSAEVFVFPTFQIRVLHHPASDGQVANQDAFGERTGKLKWRTGLPLAMTGDTGIDPL